MDKLHFDNFYKFMTSLGLVIFAAGVAVPYFYLRESFGLLVKQSDYVAMMPEGQLLLMRKLTLLSALSSGLPWVSGVLLLSGVSLILWAMHKWYRRQQVLDQKEDVDLAKAKTELYDMTDAEKERKDIAEAASTPALAPSNAKTATLSLQQIGGNVTLKDMYRMAQDRVKHAIRRQLVSGNVAFDLYSDQKLNTVKTSPGEVYEYDLVVRQPNVLDTVIEVKVVPAGIYSTNWLRNIMEAHRHRTNIYIDVLGRPAFPVLLCVTLGVTDNNADQATADELVALTGGAIIVKVIDFTQLPSYNYMDLLGERKSA